MSRTLPSLSLGILFAAAGAGPAGAKGALDEGRLDPAWFAGAGEFREADEIDYLWVRPGATLEGRKVRFADWPDPVFLGEDAGDRDAKDKRLANDLNRSMVEILAEAFRNAFGSRVAVVDGGEEIRIEGRMVDCSTGSDAAKFWVGMGAGSGSVVVDLKFLDAATGELQAAIHHRVVSGTNLSTSESKFVDWVDELADSLAKKGFDALYKKGDKRRD
jgi:hypothetical protein